MKRRLRFSAGLLVVVTALALVRTTILRGQRPSQPSSASTPRPELLRPIRPLEEGYLKWRLLPSEQPYALIDGKHLWQYVSDITAISRRYRDSGHPQFWGRIIGTEADAENEQWMLRKMRQAGLSDVHSQTFKLPPQWMPQSWEITASSAGSSVRLETAQPAYLTHGTSGSGLDLEAVYVGLGSDADFLGKDVRGKAVFVHSIPLPGSWRHTATAEGVLKRAEERGAAAIFCTIALPGNIKTQLYPTNTNVPTFSMGLDDGNAVRDLIAKAPASNPPHIKLRINVEMTSGLKTANVWGTLPGTTDENVIILAHRDGWFEAANDNASGMAAFLGLAEYFAAVPKGQRRRTITFIATTGHHNGAAVGGTWLSEHKELFAKTALIINLEHVATVQTYLYGPTIRKANMAAAFFWYVGGSPRLMDVVVKAFDAFGVSTYAEPERSPAGEMGRIYQEAPSVQVIDCSMFFHSDAETADTVPFTGLGAITRAYAKIVSDIDGVPLRDLVPPQGTALRNEADHPLEHE